MADEIHPVASSAPAPEADGVGNDDYKVAFLNSAFLLAGVLAFLLGFADWPRSQLLGLIDFSFAALNAGLLIYLRHHRDQVEQVSTLALLLSFGLFLSVYVLATYNVMRLSLFFLMTAGAFFLKGRREGRVWLVAILLSIIGVHLLSGPASGYGHMDILAACLYLFGLYAIFENYETHKASQHERERQQAARLLVESLARQRLNDEKLSLQAILDNAPLGIWLRGVDGELKFVNKTFCAAMGLPPSQMAAVRRYADVLPPEVATQCERTDQEALARDSAHVSHEWAPFADGRSHLLEITKVKVHHPDGSLRGLIGLAADVTEREQAEERRQLLARVFENTQEGILILDRSGCILEVNDAYLRLTGHVREELVGQTLRSVQSDMQEADWRRAWDLVAAQGYWRGEVWGRRKSGELRAEILTLSAITNAEAEATHYVAISSDITLLKQHEKELEMIAHYDPLTGVPNRVLLADRLTQAMAYARRERTLLAVCYLDLDGFKQVNDTLGHEAGDAVLIEVTQRIRRVIRGNDTVARLGGDEFVVLLAGQSATEECYASLHRLLEVIRQPVEIGNERFEVSASIGVALYPDGDQEADLLLRHADQAMYQAKKAGKNRYVLYRSGQYSQEPDCP